MLAPGSRLQADRGSGLYSRQETSTSALQKTRTSWCIHESFVRRGLERDPGAAMTATRPEDVAALFDLPPLPEAPRSTNAATEAEEAALAAELAATIESGGVADDAPESRTDLRVEVSWPARMRLPDGHLIELRVRNISEGGVGLMSVELIPADTVVSFEMDVPPIGPGGHGTTVEGTIKTTYTVAHGPEILCGSTWQGSPAGLELVGMWIRRLRG